MVASIQAPISELEKRLKINFDQKALENKVVELKSHIEKKKLEAKAKAATAAKAAADAKANVEKKKLEALA